MKYFPLTLHVVLATCAIGLAAGLNAENARPVYQYTANGLAIGLGGTAFVRFLFTVF